MDIFPSIFFAPFWLLVSLFFKEEEYYSFEGTVSAIVPAHNEEANIYNCVTALDGHVTEVVVVLDGCNDATMRELYRARDDMRKSRVVLVNMEQNGGKSRALNFGIEASTGDVIVTIDADTVIGEGAIENLISHLNGYDAVCGATRSLWPRTPIQRWRSLTKLLSVNVLRRGMSRAGSLFCMPGALTAYKREIIYWVNGFDESFFGAEDMELTWRIMSAGGRIRFCPNAVIFAEDPATLGAQWRQYQKWFMGYVQVVRRHWRLMFRRPGLLLITVQGWIMSYILLFFLPIFLWTLPGAVTPAILIAVGLVLIYTIIAIVWTRSYNSYYLVNIPFALLWIPMSVVVRIAWVYFGTKALFSNVGRVKY